MRGEREPLLGRRNDVGVAPSSLDMLREDGDATVAVDKTKRKSHPEIATITNRNGNGEDYRKRKSELKASVQKLNYQNRRWRCRCDCDGEQRRDRSAPVPPVMDRGRKERKLGLDLEGKKVEIESCKEHLLYFE